LLFAVFRAWLIPSVRAYWGPFAVTSAVYVGIVSMQPLVDLHYNLPTTQLVLYGLDKLQQPIPTPTAGYATLPTGLPADTNPAPAVISYVVPQTIVGYVNYDRENLFELAITRTSGGGFHTEARSFLWVAQCLWCLLLAALAGMACSWTKRRRGAFTGQNQTKPVA
jgi:hypothetical protein